MFLYPLALGIVSTFSPFIGMILVMTYCARNLGPAITSPQRALTAFFLLPAILMLLDNSTQTLMVALDAVFGVGIIAYVFLLSLRKNQILSESFMIGSLMLCLYGMLRMKLFGDYINLSFDEGMKLITERMPALIQSDYMLQSLALWKNILPAVWVVGQIMALLIGFVFMHKIIGIPFKASDMRFPPIFNFIIIAILPLYLFQDTRILFVNAMLSLCTIPLIQGFCSVSTGISRMIANVIVRNIVMVVLVIYAFIPLTLIGFADLWLGYNKNR